MNNHIYTIAEHKYLLLPQDQKLIKELVGTNRLNNTVIDLLDQRQAEFDAMREKYKPETLDGAIYLWQIQNNLLPKEVEIEEPEEETINNTSDHFSINESDKSDEMRDMMIDREGR